MRLLPLLLDLLAVVVFAAAGRRSHDGEDGVLGVLDIAWPFATGAVVGHLLVLAVPRLRAAGAATLLAGVVVWPVTVLLGMVLRRVAGDGTAWTFVLVATAVLGALLLGWRLVARLRAPARRRSRSG